MVRCFILHRLYGLDCVCVCVFYRPRTQELTHVLAQHINRLPKAMLVKTVIKAGRSKHINDTGIRLHSTQLQQTHTFKELFKFEESCLWGIFLD